MVRAAARQPFNFRGPMKKKNTYPLWKRWSVWSLVLLLAIFTAFTLLELQSEVRQPSQRWSMAIDLSSEITLDPRALDATFTPSGTLRFGQLDKGQVHLYSIDHGGQLTKTHGALLPSESAKVLRLEGDRAYISDRDRLWYLDEASEFIEVGGSTEHFDVSGAWIVAGDDQIVSLYKLEGDQLSLKVRGIEGYTNLRNLKIKDYQMRKGDPKSETCYFVVDAESGSSLFKYQEGQGLKSVTLGTAQDFKAYGMVRDLEILGDQVTLATHKYNHLEPAEPTIIGIRQFDLNTLAMNRVYYYYHVGTNLEPQLVGVDGDQVSYVLGMSQTQSMSGTLARYPQAEGGKIVNVSHLTRRGDTLVENERITATRDYPVFYKLLDVGRDQVVIWVDRRAGRGHLRLAGTGAEWIGVAKANLEIPWTELLLSVIMGMVNSLVIGLMYAAIMLLDAKWGILLALVLLGLYSRFGPGKREDKATLCFWAAVLTTLVVKWYVYGLNAYDFKYFARVYPFFFGASLVMQATQVVTTVIAIGIYKLWYLQHPYYKNRWAHFGVYIGLETAILLLTSIALFMNAMMKVKFMM